jgi:hypothetical protein
MMIDCVDFRGGSRWRNVLERKVWDGCRWLALKLGLVPVKQSTEGF